MEGVVAMVIRDGSGNEGGRGVGARMGGGGDNRDEDEREDLETYVKKRQRW